MTENKKIELSINMLEHIVELFDKLTPEKVKIDDLKVWEDKEIGASNVLDFIQIETFANETKNLMVKCKNYSAVSGAFASEAKRQLNKAEALYTLNQSEDDWRGQQEKYKSKDDNYKVKSMTADIRSSLLAVNEVVEKYNVLKIKWDTLAHWFEDTYRTLENSHNWYKKLYDKACPNNKE